MGSVTCGGKMSDCEKKEGSGKWPWGGEEMDFFFFRRNGRVRFGEKASV